MDLQFIFDSTALIVGFLAFIAFWRMQSHVHDGELRPIIVWLMIAFALVLFRKVADFSGEYLFVSANAAWNIVEDIAFLLSLLAFFYAASLMLEFFKKIDFKH